MSAPAGFTNDELAILCLTAALWNRFLGLPSLHPDDVPEFRAKLHDLQRIIMARVGHRELARSDIADLMGLMAEKVT